MGLGDRGGHRDSLEGEEVFLPNTGVLENAITNRVRQGSRRSTLVVGVDYSTDLAAAHEVLTAAAAAVDGVHADPAPRSFGRDFADWSTGDVEAGDSSQPTQK